MIEQALQWGLPIPDLVLNKPILAEGLEMYMDAFWTLSSCRSVGMGMGPIPWDSVLRYGTLLALDEEHQADLEFFISRLDSAFLKWASEDRKQGNT